jgi:dethiobiotin synthetase
MAALFVTATGTDLGKTYVAAQLVRHLRARGRRVRALKPVVSGFTLAGAAQSDPGVLLAALGVALDAAALDAIAPWRYTAPLAPTLAAQAEGTSVPFDALVRFCRDAIAAAARDRAEVVIEGVGGVMVPLDARHTVLDWIAALGIPTLLVAGSYLGAISHTLTALAALRTHSAPLAAVLVDETPGGVTLDATCAEIARFAPDVDVIGIARGADADRWSAACDRILDGSRPRVR